MRLMKQITRLWNEVLTTSSTALVELESAPGPKPTREMCTLLVLGEDRRYYFHSGVDPIALARSVWMTCVYGRRQGGSTIAMQLVRTITGRYQRTIWRKVTEIALAVRITHSFDRTDIARIYLWLAYYGWNMHGFQDACNRLSLAPLTASSIESAQLVARLKYPQPRFENGHQLHRISQRAQHLLALNARYMRSGTVLGTLNHGTISNS
jgi:membrane carboxypeptidase/penicillin-binding protein PbpC